MGADVTTVAVDAFRTGWDRDEPGLSPSMVSAADFGLLYSVAVMARCTPSLLFTTAFW
jgi:hypothetical protein